MVSQRKVHADYATWTAYEDPSGRITCSKGRFKGDGLDSNNYWSITVPAGHACEKLMEWLETRELTVRTVKQRPPKERKPEQKISLPSQMQRIMQHPDHEAGLESIRARHWEGVECYPRHMALAADIADPVEAFQVAFFLNWKRLIDRKCFDSIREETAYASRQKDYGPIRIVVQPDKVPQLMSLLDPGMQQDKSWAEAVATSAQRPFDEGKGRSA